MKRSFINQSIQWAKGVLDEYGIHLPRFAYWSMRDWEKYKDKTQAIRHLMLGWDVTDYGLGRFDEIGGVLFTARNGDIYDQKAGTPYAEKYIVMKPGQRLPMHMHKIKTEDIVSRCGGAFCIRLNASGGDGKVDERAPVAYRSDEMEYSVPAGSVVEIENGSSITLTPS